MRSNDPYDTTRVLMFRAAPELGYTDNVVRDQRVEYSFSYRKNLSHHYDWDSLSQETDVRTISKIQHGNSVMVLNWPITVTIEQQESLFIASNDEMNIHGVGCSKDEALEDFYSSFVHFWKYYVEVGDDRLTGLARKLKALFSHIVKETIDADSKEKDQGQFV